MVQHFCSHNLKCTQIRSTTLAFLFARLAGLLDSEAPQSTLRRYHPCKAPQIPWKQNEKWHRLRQHISLSSSKSPSQYALLHKRNLRCCYPQATWLCGGRGMRHKGSEQCRAGKTPPHKLRIWCCHRCRFWCLQTLKGPPKGACFQPPPQNKQQAASSKQQAASSKLQAASSKQQAASSKQQAASNKQQATSNKQQQTTNNKQQTTNKKQETTNNKQQTRNKEQQTTNNKRSTATLDFRCTCRTRLACRGIGLCLVVSRKAPWLKSLLPGSGCCHSRKTKDRDTHPIDEHVATFAGFLNKAHRKSGIWPHESA